MGRRERTSCSGPRCEMGRDDVRESKPIQYAENRGPRFASRPGLRRLLCNSTRLAVKRCTRTQDDHWSHAPEGGNWRGTMTTCNLPVPLSRSVTEVIIIVLASVIHLIILPSPSVSRSPVTNGGRETEEAKIRMGIKKDRGALYLSQGRALASDTRITKGSYTTPENNR